MNWTMVNLEMASLSELERKFYFVATARNIPKSDIAKIIGWQRSGVVDLNSFFVVANKPLRRFSRVDYFKAGMSSIYSACRFRVPLGWIEQ